MESVQGLWKRFVLLQLSLVFVSLTVFSMGLNSFAAAQQLNSQQIQTVTPHDGRDGKDATVDYNKISDIVEKTVDSRLSQLPQPHNGANGSDGKNGVDGHDGKSGNDGKNGTDGLTIAPREIQLQSNPTTGDLQWKYDGDTFWQLLLEKCKITNTCETN